MLTIAHSCNCLQPRPGPRRSSRGAKRLSIRGSWDQNQCNNGQGKWADQPLPFDVHIAVCTVRTHLRSRAVLHFTHSLDSSGHFVEYLLNRPDVKDAWRAHTEHEFVQRLADGTLPVEKFKNYLIQDYLFLVGLPSQKNDPKIIPANKRLARCNSRAPKP